MKGSCACGRIQYEVQKLASVIQHCSCRTCRKSHAAAFNTAAAVKPEHFKWLSGEQLLRAFESSPGKHRYFCSHCGTHLIKRTDGRATFALRVATLDDDPKQVPEIQIWASHQVPWLHYGPEVAVYPEWGPGHK
ncbi:GFA family protein [Pseudothauera nasutitermitis]|uniref:GFA family protein n=1 Tax=Pseudothauera nasutitermitis TaxID=2565930 RepID=A0A4S4AN63_9RHOO|nr:GFA family protein [Pseudothauera nasutitermitis]THF61076.1 GFA family protein [Pseudothauera nasutitermitis]